MNLLTDPWVPVQQSGKTRLITLKEVLCVDSDYHITLPRDDMELACLQLIICLTQVLFLPDTAAELKRRIRIPLNEDEYVAGTQGYLDWFDLRHPETPFMQVRRVKAKRVTPIQKMLLGLPAGTSSHAFFNDPNEISQVDQSIAAIALFNMANNFSYGGGIKEGLRVLGQKAPITTLMSGRCLRQTIWFNVLHEQHILTYMPEYIRLKGNDKPVWVDQIKPRSRFSAHEIGLLRGLFWQPAHVELRFCNNKKSCDFLGLNSTDDTVCGFNIEKFGSQKTGGYDIEGTWIHPHSPRVLDIKKGTQRYLSFTSTAPAWTQLNHLLVASKDKKAGFIPAEIVRQFKHDLVQSDQLIVGGYRNKQASILQRRHEYFPLRPGWDKNGFEISRLVRMALEIKTLLRNKLFSFVKATGASAVNEKAQAMFYHQSEPLIHRTLREMDWSQSNDRLVKLQEDLINMSWKIFDQVTRPYAHEPKMIKALAVAKISLGGSFKKLKDNQP
jgi:CRISPR system Cascade subunit CasA